MADFYEIKTAATTDPSELEEVKSFMYVDISDDDTLIKALFQSAVLLGEKLTGRVFVERTFTGKFSQMETSRFECYPFITLRRGPLVSVTSVKVMIDDVLTAVPSDDWQVKEDSAYARILFTNTPVNSDDVPYPLEVEFIAGYGEATDVPEDIKIAAKQHTLFLYENRGDVVPEGKINMPIVARTLYKKYRIINTFG